MHEILKTVWLKMLEMYTVLVFTPKRVVTQSSHDCSLGTFGCPKAKQKNRNVYIS